MKAYDLDGVIVADLEGPIEQVLAARKLMRALFVPYEPYAIITGRPIMDEWETRLWVDVEMRSHPPTAVHIGAAEGAIRSAVKWKIDTLRAHPEYDTFIESDMEQVHLISDAVPKCRVLHFGTFASLIF
jgi:hypothetical protein